MRVLSVRPGEAGSVTLESLDPPEASEGPLLVKTRLVGVCGTDLEIQSGLYGAAPPGRDRLVLGHESLGEVVEAPAGSVLRPGDLVAAMVRRPDPLPCENCAAGEWDMCRNGLYTEHDIRGLDGFARDYYRSEESRLVKLDGKLGDSGVLLEPASIVAKAWEHIEHLGRRALWNPREVLVAGAGPIGLLAALLARQRGLEVRLFDRNAQGPKPEIARLLGASYHTEGLVGLAESADVILECTGAPALVFDLLCHSKPNSIACLLGVRMGSRKLTVDAAAINRNFVLENSIVFGSVNANRRHYELAALALEKAEPGFLGTLIRRRVPPDRWPDAFERKPGDIKTVLDFRS